MSDPQTKKIVYFVRHGQSVDNIAPIFQSQNSPLSPVGREQAKIIAARVTGLSFETIVASPVRRAKETAEIIAKIVEKNPKYSDLFVERIKPSAIDGKPYEDSVANKIWRDWEKSLYTPGMRVADGENYDDLIMRADKALAFLKDQTEQSVVVVTHGYFLRTIVARVILGDLLTGEIFKNFQKIAHMENTGLTVLKYQSAFEEEPRWRLWIYNDHAHLAE